MTFKTPHELTSLFIHKRGLREIFICDFFYFFYFKESIVISGTRLEKQNKTKKTWNVSTVYPVKFGLKPHSESVGIQVSRERRA